MCKCAHVWLLFRRLVHNITVYHYYRSYWCNIILCSRIQTDLMWINRHPIIIGLQSQEHDAESNFNDAVFFLFPVSLRNTLFSLCSVSCISPFLFAFEQRFVWCISLWFYWISLLLQFKSHVKRVLTVCFGGTHHIADDTTEKKLFIDK